MFDGGKIFNIPKYQRAYAWEEKQLKDFVEDIENQKPGRNYFFGTILFQEQERSERFEIIDIVDGQQRITTLIIFMKLLLAEHKKAGNGIEQEKAVPIDLDKGAFSDSSFENVFEDEVLERTFREIAPTVFQNAAPQIIEAVSRVALSG